MHFSSIRYLSYSFPYSKAQILQIFEGLAFISECLHCLIYDLCRDLTKLAKLAVAGDERALDLLSWNPQSKTLNLYGQKQPGSGLDGCAFFIGTDDGSFFSSHIEKIFV